MRTSGSKLCVAAILFAAATAVSVRSAEASTIGESQETATSDERPQRDLTLDGAVSLALQLNPTLAAAGSAVFAAEARVAAGRPAARTPSSSLKPRTSAAAVI